MNWFVVDHIFMRSDVLRHNSIQIVNFNSNVVLLTIIKEPHVATWIFNVVFISVHDVGHGLHQNCVTTL